MANLPLQNVPSVAPQGPPANDYQRIDPSPADFGGLQGAAEQRTGSQLDQASGDIAQAAQVIQQRHNALATTGAFNNYQTQLLSLTGGDPNTPGDKGYFGTTGRDAMDGYPTIAAKIGALRDQTKAGLQNDAQRLEFDQDSRRLQMFTLDSMRQHYLQQSNIYSIGLNQATEANQQRAVAVQPANDTNFNNSTAEAYKGAVRAAQDRYGTNPDPQIIQNEMGRAATGLVKARVQAWAPSDPGAALNWLQNGQMPGATPGQMVPVRTSIDPAAYDELYKSLHAQSTKLGGEGLANDTWNATGPGGLGGGAAKDLTPAIRSRAQLVHDEVVRQGGSDGEGWGWAANAVHESSAQTAPDAGDGGVSHGMFQLNGAQLAAYRASHGGQMPEQGTVAEQVAFARKQTGDLSGVKGGPEAYAATINDTFEKPAGGVAEGQNRGQTALALAAGGAAAPQGSAAASPSYPDESAGVQRIIAATEAQPELRASALSAYEQKVRVYALQTATERKNIQKQYADATDALEAGKSDITIPEDRIRAVFDPATANDMLSKLETAKSVGQIFSGVQWGSPEDISAARDDLASGLGARSALLRASQKSATPPTQGPGAVPDMSMPVGGTAERETPDQFGMRQRVLARFDQVVAARSAALRADPAGYVASSPTVAPAISALDPKNPATMEEYTRATLAAQDHLGVPEQSQHILSSVQATQAAARLTSADPATTDVGGLIDQTATQYGAAWPKAWGDMVTLGKLPPEYQVLGVMQPGPDRMQMQRAIQTATKKGGIENMRKDVDPVAAQSIDRDIDGALDDFRKTVMIPGLAGNPELFSTVRNAVRTSALYGVMSGQGSDALNRSVQATLPYDFVGLARAPKGEGGVAEQYGNDMLRSLTPDAIAQPKSSAANLTADQTRAAYLAGTQRSGAWVTNEHDDGWSLAVPSRGGGYQLVLHPDGSRVGFKFSDLPKGGHSGASGSIAVPPPVPLQ